MSASTDGAPAAGRSATAGRPVRRVCVFAQLHGPGLGDMVQRNMMLSLLHRAHPDATVTLVLGPKLRAQYADYQDAHCYATDLMMCPDPFDTDPEHWKAFLAELRAREFDLCLVDPGSHGLSAEHAHAAGIKVRLGYPQGRPGDAYLTTPIRLRPPVLGFPDLYDYASALSGALRIKPPLASEAVPPLPRKPEELPARRTAGPLIAIHAVGQPHWNRRWPLDRFGVLGARLVREFDAELCLLGTQSEIKELTRLREGVLAEAPSAHVRIEADASLNRTANLLAGADLLIGNDSSLLHVAAGVGTPTVAILGPTGTQLLWARVYPRHRGVSLHYPCQGIVHEVDEVAGRECEFRCTVPYQGADGPYPRCLTDLGEDKVFQEAAAELRLRPMQPGGVRAQ